MERIGTEGRERELHYLKPLNSLLLEIMSCEQQSTKGKINTILNVTQSSTQAQQSFLHSGLPSPLSAISTADAEH